MRQNGQRMVEHQIRPPLEEPQPMVNCSQQLPMEDQQQQLIGLQQQMMASLPNLSFATNLAQQVTTLMAAVRANAKQDQEGQFFHESIRIEYTEES